MAKPPSSKPRQERGWAITGTYGFYYGSFHATRRAAIEDHTGSIGLTWEECKAKGDRCIKVSMKAAL